MEVRLEEDVGEGEDTKEDTQDDTDCVTGTKFFKGGRCRGLNDNEEGEDSGRDGKVEGNDAEGPLEGILAL